MPSKFHLTRFTSKEFCQRQVRSISLVAITNTRSILQSRCENILRTNPDSRIAAELHLASIASKEEQDKETLKKAAVGGVAAAAAVGLVARVASLLIKR